MKPIETTITATTVRMRYADKSDAAAAMELSPGNSLAVELIRALAEQLDNRGFFVGHGRMFHGR